MLKAPVLTPYQIFVKNGLCLGALLSFFVVLPPSALGDSLNEALHQAKQLGKQFDELYLESVPASMLTADRQAFIKGVLLPLLGDKVVYLDSESASVRRWKFFPDKIEIHGLGSPLNVVWSARIGSKPKANGPFLVIPRTDAWRWSGSYIASEGVRVIRNWVRETELVAHLDKVAAIDGFAESLPTLKATKSGVQDADSSRAVQISPSLSGAKTFSQITPLSGKAYIHPDLGWITVEDKLDSQGGTLFVRRGRPSSIRKERRTKRKLVEQESIVLASENTPAAKALMRERALRYAPVEHIAMIMTYDLLWRRTRKDVPTPLERAYEAVGSLDGDDSSLSRCLSKIKNQLLHRGISDDNDYRQPIHWMKRLVDTYFDLTGEDLVLSAVLESMRAYKTGEWNLGRSFGDQIAAIEKRVFLDYQIAKLPQDVQETFRILVWRQRRHALGDETAEVTPTKQWVHDLTEFRSYRDPSQLADENTRDIRLVIDFHSLDVARAFIRRHRKTIEQISPPEQFDVFVSMPSRGDKFSASSLFTESIIDEWQLDHARWVEPLSLARASAHSQQRLLTDLIDRLENLHGKFKATTGMDKEMVLGKRVLLVDDLSTSYGTIAEAKRLLMEMGADSVTALSMGHVSNKNTPPVESVERSEPYDDWRQHFAPDNPPIVIPNGKSRKPRLRKAQREKMLAISGDETLGPTERIASYLRASIPVAEITQLERQRAYAYRHQRELKRLRHRLSPDAQPNAFVEVFRSARNLEMRNALLDALDSEQAATHQFEWRNALLDDYLTRLELPLNGEFPEHEVDIINYTQAIRQMDQRIAYLAYLARLSKSEKQKKLLRKAIKYLLQQGITWKELMRYRYPSLHAYIEHLFVTTYQNNVVRQNHSFVSERLPLLGPLSLETLAAVRSLKEQTKSEETAEACSALLVKESGEKATGVQG